MDPLGALDAAAFANVLALAGAAAARRVCRAWRDFADANRRTVAFSPGCSRAFVCRTCERAAGTLTAVSLRSCDGLGDQLDGTVLDVLGTLPGLRHLDVGLTGGCFGASAGRAQMLAALIAHPALATVDLTGCWRVLAPHPRLHPTEVISLQVCALSSHDAHPHARFDGIKACYQFAAPANRAFTGPLERFTKMLTSAYQDLLRTRSFALRELDSGALLRAPDEGDDDVVDRRFYLVESQIGVAPAPPPDADNATFAGPAARAPGLTPLRAAPPPPPGSLHPAVTSAGAVVPWQGTRWFLFELTAVSVDPADGSQRPHTSGDETVWCTASVRGPIDYWVVRGLLTDSGHGPLPQPRDGAPGAPGSVSGAASLTKADLARLSLWTSVA